MHRLLESLEVLHPDVVQAARVLYEWAEVEFPWMHGRKKRLLMFRRASAAKKASRGGSSNAS